jgi:preprotein translocase subunit SecF
MKTLKVIFVSAILVAASTIGAMAQDSGKNMSVNGNYKHQFPTSKETKFKDSFNNEGAEKASERNYKRQAKRSQVEKSATSNQYQSTKKGNANSKHPYGL